MSLLGKLFGKEREPVNPSSQPQQTGPTPPPAKPTAKAPDRTIEELRNDPNMIRVFDKYGREMFMTKEAWRTGVLPGTLQKEWDKPDALYSVIASALQDGFQADVVAATQHLYEIDTDPVRGACIWGIVLMKVGRLDESEGVFRDCTSKHGEQGVILTNLAKVYSERKDDAKAEEVLWRALQVDPNQDNALQWYVARHRERSGEAAGVEAYRRVAALPGSWRAQLWLARDELHTKGLDAAMSLYRECLQRIVHPIPADALMQMSGDLGKAGFLPELLQLVEPHFDVKTHGLQVGNNLIKAHLDLGHLDDVRRILDQLYALNRMDWKQSLSFWDTELAKSRVAQSPAPDEPISMRILTLEGPVWLKPTSPAASLFPIKSPNSTVIAFLGSSAEVNNKPDHIQRQMADAPGRMSRALPLFLAEQVSFGSQARVKPLVPWINEAGGGGFVLSGIPWGDENAIGYVKQSNIPCEYLVTTHLKTVSAPWGVELHLLRVSDGQRLDTSDVTFPMEQPEKGVPGLTKQLMASLSRHASVTPTVWAPLYQNPDEELFPIYLLRLEQLLAVRCAGMDEKSPGPLSGERDIIDGNIQLCVDCPKNVGVRLILAQTVAAMKRARPNILPEFKTKLASLQNEHPLPEPAHSIIQQILTEAL